MSTTTTTQTYDTDIDEPEAITMVNDWLAWMTCFCTLIQVVANPNNFTAERLAEYAGCTVYGANGASSMLSSYKRYNRLGDMRCKYVIAHEGHSGVEAPWSILSTTYDITTEMYEVLRCNRIRHASWKTFTYANHEIESFAADQRQAIVQILSKSKSTRTKGELLDLRNDANARLQEIRALVHRRVKATIKRERIPKGKESGYMTYYFNSYMPLVEVRIKEEIAILDALLASRPAA